MCLSHAKDRQFLLTLIIISVFTYHTFTYRTPLISAYFTDYGSGCLGALGVLAALLRRAEG